MLPTGDIFNKTTMKGIFSIAYLNGLEGNLTLFLIILQTHFSPPELNIWAYSTDQY